MFENGYFLCKKLDLVQLKVILSYISIQETEYKVRFYKLSLSLF